MYKIGIIGSDNSHALAFSKLCNVSNEYPDVKITHIFGQNSEETKKVAVTGKIENIVNDPAEMIGRVDAVMVVFRDGGLHAEYALPFIKNGVPTWIDKPFTISTAETKMLIEEANNSECLLTGGSTCKYAYDTLMLKNAVEADKSKVVSGMLSFPVMLNSEYGGIHFYAPHLVEMTLQIFGYDIKSVIAHKKGGSIAAVARYDSYDIVMNFAADTVQFSGIVLTRDKNIIRDIDISIIYKLGFSKFVEMLRDKKRPFDLHNMLITTTVINAVWESAESGKEVSIDV